jgi:putative addiction module component (TIGR02574 family)
MPLSDEWKDEIQRRSEEFDAGNVPTTSWDDIKAEALKRSEKFDASH